MKRTQFSGIWETNRSPNPGQTTIPSNHHHHHHHHVVPPARISLTLSRHFSLLFIASGRSSGLHPVSSHSSCMYVRAGRPAFAWPYAGVHRSTSLMSSSLLLQQCPAFLVRLTCIVFNQFGDQTSSLETRSGRESQYPAEGARRPLIEQLQLGIRRVGDKIIRCESRVKWSNPGKGVASSHWPRCSSFWKGSH